MSFVSTAAVATTIVEYAPQYQADFYRLNEAWIAPNFGMEAEDIAFLSDPQTNLIEGGGAVFIALQDGYAVGSAGLIKMDDETVELVRVAVDASAQGQGLGKQLTLHAITWAKANGFKRVILESSAQPINARAVAMYERLGFRHYTPKPEHRSALARAEVFMIYEPLH
jgi:GNAT superfamily N-acetyltransferase